MERGIEEQRSFHQQRTISSSDYPMCAAQYQLIARKFRDVVLAYHDLQLSYKERQRGRFSRQYRMVHPQVTEEQLDEILDEPYHGPVFAQSVMLVNLLISKHIMDA